MLLKCCLFAPYVYHRICLSWTLSFLLLLEFFSSGFLGGDLSLVSTICFPHVEEMCICGFVFQRYGKSTYGFRIFRHLSCSVCIISTYMYSLEHGERGHVDGSNLLFVYYTCI